MKYAIQVLKDKLKESRTPESQEKEEDIYDCVGRLRREEDLTVAIKMLERVGEIYSDLKKINY